MPDYDPKSIPILDDIIEHDNDDTASDDAGHAKAETDSSSTDTPRTEPLQDDNTRDLFNEIAADPQITFTPADANATDIETDDDETAESALIDYQVEDEPVTENEDQRQVVFEPAPADNIEITLDAVVEDIVKQLMPDLEQQLRFLVKQAMEEKMPEEIIEQILANKKSVP